VHAPLARGGSRAGVRLIGSNCWVTQGVGMFSRIVWLFLVVQLPLVHCLGLAFPTCAQTGKGNSAGEKKPSANRAAVPEIGYGSDRLPLPVREMREAILEAVNSGNIEDLRHAYELNELRPDLGVAPIGDPVAHWKEISSDGHGRAVLDTLAAILQAGYASLALGQDLENNRVYVWPYFAEVPLDGLSPAQAAELENLVAAAGVEEMKAAGKYTRWRLAIGADGTWHYFKKEP